MASTSKSSSRWGFFEKAIAGVESRLDTILGEEDANTKEEKPTVVPAATLKPLPEKKETVYSMEAVKSPDATVHATSTGKRPDKLQERLAKAMVGRTSPMPGSGTGTPSLSSTSPRTSLDRDPSQELQSSAEDQEAELTNVTGEEIAEQHARDSDVPALTLPGQEHTSDHEDKPIGSAAFTPSLTPNGSSTPRRSLDSDHDSAPNRDEVNGYLEQIESLRAKLQFLTQQATAEARERATNAEKGSTQQQIAEKDEKIALLLEEGSKLSQNEMKLMTTIRSLRVKTADDQKSLAKAKQSSDLADKSIRSLQERLKAVETSGKEDLKQKAMLESLRKDLDHLRHETKAKDIDISDLHKQLAQNAIAGQETEKIRKELEAERKTTRNLQEEVADAKLERSLLEDRHKAQLKEFEFKADRKAQDATATELDLRREIQVLETRLETYRIKAEEISTDTKGDAQAKLVRQIETLQSSYSVASENWRGIEGSLMARIAVFEKDQADAQKKETEIRRKLREVGSKHKETESQLEVARSQIQDLEESLTKESEKLKQVTTALAKTETELKSARDDLKSTRETMEARLERLESEKRDAVQESLTLRTRGQSPLLKTGFEPSIGSSRKYPLSPGLQQSGGLGFPISHSRRASAQPLREYIPQRQDSTLSLSHSGKSSIPPTPVINADDDDDFFANTPATPPERAIQDMVSTSTAGAGPSVQLVERMSAAVRRLESEKEASKDELERLSAQRDEARNQVVGLMQELEEKRKAETKSSDLEKEVAELNGKLQTTLEMLGEKSELVEELRADILDMKEIYRATLESTVK